MRLNPGIPLDQADEVLQLAERRWSRVAAADPADFYQAYLTAVFTLHSLYRKAFASPDLAGGLHSTAYWNLVLIARTRAGQEASTFPLPEGGAWRTALRAEAGALVREIEVQKAAVEAARREFDALRQLAQRPGLPVVYDTNLLNHWRQPGDVLWRQVLKAQGEDAKACRLVVPLMVVDELDRQKYGQGDLAKKAATAIRYLERVLRDAKPGEPVELRQDVTLEVWVDTDERGGDADLAILRCAADLDNLHRSTGARVLTDDTGMRLRANQMGLKVVTLPEDHRKKGTALDDVPRQKV